MSIETGRTPDYHTDDGIGDVPSVRKFRATDTGFRWDGVDLKRYKEEGTTFKDVTRQTLFSGSSDQPCELRYFEVEPGGHSTLEQHIHTHAIVILRGKGRILVGDVLVDVEPFDLLYVPPHTWHQLRAEAENALGFLCLVPCDRDRPSRPDEPARRALLSNPRIRNFIRL